MDLLLFVEGCVCVGEGTDKYLDLSTNDDDPEKPPLGIQIAVTNVPTTIGHAEQCNKLLHTILACLNNGYIFNNKDNMKILFEKDKKLFNPYGIIALNPKVFPHVEFEKSMIFIKWLLSEKGASIINSFKINDQQLFFTN